MGGKSKFVYVWIVWIQDNGVRMGRLRPVIYSVRGLHPASARLPLRVATLFRLIKC